MEISDPQYEVEIRCHFADQQEVYQRLPFFQASIYSEAAWSSGIYSLTLFKSGQLLRVGEVRSGGETRAFLHWKSRDIGTFANIRIEIGDEINNGIKGSIVLRQLGSQSGFLTAQQVTEELEQLGHNRFMGFEGHDQYGKYEPLDIDIKLMHCPALQWPLLVELEKMAGTIEETRRYEDELKVFARRFSLQDWLIHDEPPTLLYNVTFP